MSNFELNTTVQTYDLIRHVTTRHITQRHITTLASRLVWDNSLAYSRYMHTHPRKGEIQNQGYDKCFCRIESKSWRTTTIWHHTHTCCSLSLYFSYTLNVKNRVRQTAHENQNQHNWILKTSPQAYILTPFLHIDWSTGTHSICVASHMYPCVNELSSHPSPYPSDREWHWHPPRCMWPPFPFSISGCCCGGCCCSCSCCWLPCCCIVFCAVIIVVVVF